MKHLRVIVFALLPVVFSTMSNKVWAKPPRYRVILTETKMEVAQSSSLMFSLIYTK